MTVTKSNLVSPNGNWFRIRIRSTQLAGGRIPGAARPQTLWPSPKRAPQVLELPGALSLVNVYGSLRVRAAQTILGERFESSPTVHHRTKFPVYASPARIGA